jgi:hypothetical protein
MEALQQRHEELTKRHQEAISKGDNSKARRMDRLAKVIFSNKNFISMGCFSTAISRSY